MFPSSYHIYQTPQMKAAGQVRCFNAGFKSFKSISYHSSGPVHFRVPFPLALSTPWMTSDCICIQYVVLWSVWNLRRWVWVCSTVLLQGKDLHKSNMKLYVLRSKFCIIINDCCITIHNIPGTCYVIVLSYSLGKCKSIRHSKWKGCKW